MTCQLTKIFGLAIFDGEELVKNDLIGIFGGSTGVLEELHKGKFREESIERRGKDNHIKKKNKYDGKEITSL